MDKSWDELAAALDAIRPSENHSENASPNTIVNILSLQSLGQERFLQDNQAPLSNTLDDLRAFLENEGDKFHPADVLLGFFSGFAIHYFPATLVYRRRARAYEHLFGGSSKVKVDELDYGEIFDPVITRDDYADQLIDSVQKRGGRFLQLDPSIPGVNVLDREMTHSLTLKCMECVNKGRSLHLWKRTRRIPNNFKNSVPRYIPVNDTGKWFLNQSSSLKTKSMIAKKRMANDLLKSSEHPRKLVKTPSIEPSQCSTLSLGKRCSPFRHVLHSDDEE